MRTIKLANEKKRDASVSFESGEKQSSVIYVLPDGSYPRNIKILKTALDHDLPCLLSQYGDPDKLAEALLRDDPEADFERGGMILENTRKIFVGNDSRVVFGVDLYEIVKNPDGSEKERYLYNKTQANINAEIPVLWTGKFFSKSEVIRMFVFSKKYQIRHVNGLTFDFLYDMAKQLHEKKSLVLLGTGKKGMQPLIFHEGGVPYRGFLEGRIRDDKYCLILHLTNLELKDISS
jgi:hypothetical protein